MKIEKTISKSMKHLRYRGGQIETTESKNCVEFSSNEFSESFREIHYPLLTLMSSRNSPQYAGVIE